MKPDKILLDANVLYSYFLRDILLEMVVRDIFPARWTEEIQREWTHAILRAEPDSIRSNLRDPASPWNGMTNIAW